MKSSLSIEQAIGQKLLLAFVAKELPYSPTPEAPLFLRDEASGDPSLTRPSGRALRAPSPGGRGENVSASLPSERREDGTPLPLSPRERVEPEAPGEGGAGDQSPISHSGQQRQDDALDRGENVTYQDILEEFRRIQPAGITLFRAFNVDDPAQVKRLTAALQQAAREAGLPPLLIAADQEGGQLMAIDGGATPLPGNMALGAAGDPDLARRAGEVLGRELAAMGVNINYAPSCDVNVNPLNPVIGTRSFGEDPQAVARLGAAMIEGIQSTGVAAAAKHFPGHGDTASDSHHGIPLVPHALDRLNQVELPPFQAAIQAGVRLVMTAHLGLPALTGRPDLPATLSPAIMTGLLRQELGFQGVVVTDAMDMHAIQQGEGLGEEAVCAAEAGCDLLLLTTNPQSHRQAADSLHAAVHSGRLDSGQVMASAGRILALKQWLDQQPAPPDLSVVGCSEHLAVAAEIARRSITLVRDEAGLLPLQVAEGQPLAVILPRPLDLTPADTSSYVTPSLARALREFHQPVEEIIVPHAPDDRDIVAVVEKIRGSGAAVVGTINAYAQPGQAALVRAVLQTGIPTLVVALRLPYDLAAFPEAPTYLCTYSLLEPSMDALAKVIFGQAEPAGRLPVSIPGLYPRGSGIPSK